MKACAIFVTRFGNIEKIANALAAGLTKAGVETTCVNAKDVVVASLTEFDLLCVGAPTEAFTASPPMKEFLSRLKSVNLSGKLGFAFDTRLESRLAGSASKFIQRSLEGLGLRIAAPHESAIVFGSKPSKLREGEEERFRQIGARIGEAVVMGMKEIRA